MKSPPRGRDRGTSRPGASHTQPAALKPKLLRSALPPPDTGRYKECDFSSEWLPTGGSCLNRHRLAWSVQFNFSLGQGGEAGERSLRFPTISSVFPLRRDISGSPPVKTTNASDDPLSNLVVRIRVKSREAIGNEEAFSRVRLQRTRTDTEGRYEFRGLPVGNAVIVDTRPGTLPVKEERDLKEKEREQEKDPRRRYRN